MRIRRNALYDALLGAPQQTGPLLSGMAASNLLAWRFAGSVQSSVRSRSNHAKGGAMMNLACVAILTAMACIGFSDARSEVFSRSYSAPGWNSDAPSHYYMDVPVDLGFGVAAVDSIWVEIAGATRVGRWIMDFGGVWLIEECRDLLFASFVGEPSQGDCGPSIVLPDGIPECIAGTHRTSGAPGDPFAACMYLSAVEWFGSYPRSFSVVTPRPELGDLFRDGVATLRIQEIDAGIHNACVDGLADIAIITVNVAYSPALPVASSNWGSLKALYR